MQLSEKLSYRKLLEKADEERNIKAYDALTKIGPPPWDDLKHDRIHQKYIDVFGGGIAHDGELIKKMVLNLLTSTEYTLRDCVRFVQGKFFSMKYLQEEIQQLNLDEIIHRVNIPIYFIVGSHDLTAPPDATEAFFKQVEAPEKQWIMFENSAHSPIWEEPEKFFGNSCF